MKKSAKIITATLAAITVIFAAMAISVSAETETETKPEIISQNIAYTGDFALMYAVDPATVTAPVTINIYEEAPTETSTAKYTFTETATTPAAESGLDNDAYVFITNGTAAKDMTKVYYAQAVDANGNKSEVKRYSVTEYLYERLATSDITEKQEALYQAVITFGDKAIDLLAAGNPLVSDYKYVTIEGGTLDGTYDAGIYLTGDSVYPQADGITSWTASDGTEVANEAEYVIGNSHVSFAKTQNNSQPAVETITIDRTKATYNFEAYNLDTRPSAFGYDNGFKNDNTGIKNDTVYGEESKVLVADPTSVNHAVIFYLPALDVAESDDIAYEMSADMKLVPDAGTTDFTHQFLFYDPSWPANLIFYINVRSYNGGWEFTNTQNADENVFVDGTGYNYNHVCFRFSGEPGSLVAKLYINGVYVYEFATRMANTETYGFEDMYSFRFASGNVNSTAYFDNIFCGFVKE